MTLGKKTNIIQPTNVDVRINNVYTLLYEIDDKLNKLIKYLEDMTEDPCHKKILELISGKRPY